MPKYNKLHLDFIRIISYMLIHSVNFTVILNAISKKCFHNSSGLRVYSSLKICGITSEACKYVNIGRCLHRLKNKL